ncbi:thermostable hemolysin [Nitrospirillum iridis]|uniref:Thermostable hemolysin n=1 Tax=Nitrospirillum iridis TaxID=765888 RepID=A0A7X0EDN2_9PROT|nr:thermostable hemolysin [Nitrospirillum iridis]MBB6251206.1 hypothetical protein [Nitrospirillum iridis]
MFSSLPVSSPGSASGAAPVPAQGLSSPDAPGPAIHAGGQGPNLQLLMRDHPLRPAAEDMVRDLYRDTFGARLPNFPRLMVATFDAAERPVCAAGLRTSSDGFFSECYLDNPVDRVLSVQAGRHVHRSQVFEVTTLASRSPSLCPRFVCQIARFGEVVGFEWSFFTATRRLRGLLNRLGLPVRELAAADPARLPNAGQWGRYYDQAPMVCAGGNAWETPSHA